MFGFLAQLLAWCFDLVPNYAVAITLFTVIVMAAVTPFTIKGMRSAAEMSRLQPQMKKLQDQYKNDRVKQNEEIQALFKEHGVNPLGGCLPTLLPLPIFFIIFRLLRGLNGRHNGVFAPLVRVLRHQVGGPSGYVAPHYLTYKSSLTQHIIASNGVMKSFGFDLAATARDHHPNVGTAIPYYALIAIMTVSQYWQQRQINQRNPAAANANPQMKLTMQIFPAFYALISLSIPASVVFYLFTSGLYRMAQNSISYRYDPVLARAATEPAVIEAKSRPASSGSKGDKAAALAPAPKKQGFLASLREAANQAKAPPPASPASANGSGKAGAGAKKSSPNTFRGGSTNKTRSGPAAPPPAAPRAAVPAPAPAAPAPAAPAPAAPPPAPAVASSPAEAASSPTESSPAESSPAESSPAESSPAESSPAESSPVGPNGGEVDTPRSPLSVRPSGRFTPPGNSGGGKRFKKRG